MLLALHYSRCVPKAVSEEISRKQPFTRRIMPEGSQMDLNISEIFIIPFILWSASFSFAWADTPTDSDTTLINSRIMEKQGQSAERAKQELSLWNTANQAATISSYYNYLNNYPRGQFAKLAHERIEKIRRESIGTLASLDESLVKIYGDYMSLPKTSENVEKLYQLHLKVKNTRDEIVKFDPGIGLFSKHQKEYEALGLYIGAFSETLDYSNKLLIEINTINPNSTHQEEAWYASIYEGREYGGPGDLETLEEYIKEYPRGKYSSRIYHDLGNYYYGLYKYLKYGLDSDTNRSSCYSYDSNRSIKDQLKEAQSAGIALYKKAFDLEREESIRKVIKWDLQAITSGANTEGDSWCDTDD
jgi:hypothetical protein